MSHREITMVREGIHNPNEPRHFMRLKPVERTVRVFAGDTLLVETTNALRLLEVGRDLYDPALYIPQADMSVSLSPIAEQSTHCPLKGDACYFGLPDGGTDPIAWMYDRPLPFAEMLNGYVSFYADQVRIEEVGAHAR